MPTAVPAGVYVGGGGIAPVPKKVADKILKWEYVEMGELLPEFWGSGKEDEQRAASQSRRSRKVTDISTWTQCFATYVSVLGPPQPSGNPGANGLHDQYCASEPRL